MITCYHINVRKLAINPAIDNSVVGADRAKFVFCCLPIDDRRRNTFPNHPSKKITEARFLGCLVIYFPTEPCDRQLFFYDT